jgi:1-phosphatidylinositol-4-phosphate 5-kinase
MLARFYGIYTVKIKFMKPISIIIMDNLMSNQIKQITSIYDLKGSLHRRDTRKIKNNRTVRKDLNFLRDTDNIVKMSLSQREDFKKRLYKDKEFLKKCNLMDYSLLLITFKKEPPRGVDDSTASLFRQMTMKKSGGSPYTFKVVNQSLDNCNLKKI